LRVLLACEESQAVCIEFRKLEHEAYSNDIQDCSGGFPEWHLQCDVFEAINSRKWDLMIAFPPCTHLAVSGARHFEKKRKDGRQQQGIDFFMKTVNANIPKIAIENPVGIMSNLYRKPDQIIQPYYFGDKAQKTTCLWLKNLKPLYHNAEPNLFDSNITHSGKGKFLNYGNNKSMSEFIYGSTGKLRSKTFPGIAKAMAMQWGGKI